MFGRGRRYSVRSRFLGRWQTTTVLIPSAAGEARPEKARESLQAAACTTVSRPRSASTSARDSTAEPMSRLVKEALAKDRHQGRNSEIADAQMSDADHRGEEAGLASPKALSHTGCRDRLIYRKSIPASRWNHRQHSQNAEWTPSHREAPLRTRQGQIRRRRKKLNAMPFRRDAADSALAAQSGRGDGDLDRRIHYQFTAGDYRDSTASPGRGFMTSLGKR